MSNTISVLIVEDHALTRIGLKTAIQVDETIKVLAEAEDGAIAIKKAKELIPDVILMDLGLPAIDGIEATRIIKEENKKVKVIILTSHNSETEIISALSAGADAYCLKDINPERLITVIKNVFEGGSWLDPSVAKIVFTKFGQSQNKQMTEESPLSPREIEILQLLANGLNNFEIADELGLSHHTIKSHISNTLQKLAVDDRVQAIVKAMRAGWVS